MQTSLGKRSNKKGLRWSAILFLLLIITNNGVSAIEAQEVYELLWSYKIIDGVNSVSVSSDGSYIGAGSNDKKVYFFNHEGKLLWSYFQTVFFISSVSISGDGNYIFAGGTDKSYPIANGEVYFLNRAGALLWSFKAKGVSSVSVSADGTYKAMTYGHGLGWADIVYFFNNKSSWYDTIGREGTGDSSISADGNYIAVGGGTVLNERKGIQLYNREGRLLWRYEIPDSFIGVAHSVSISADGKYIAAGNEEDNKVYLLNRDGEVLWTYRTDKPIKDVSISADGNYIAVGSKDDKVYLLNRERKLLWMNSKFEGVSSVSISTDGNSMVVGDRRGIYFFQKLHIVVLSLINKAKSAISQVKSEGFVVTDVEIIFHNAESSFSSGDYMRAKDFAERAQEKAIEINRLASEGKDLISEAKAAIEAEKTKGFNLAEPKNLLSQAQNSFIAGDYPKAKSLAEEAKSKARTITKEATLAKSAIEEARVIILQEKAKGYQVQKAEEFYETALRIYNTFDYFDSKLKAERAKVLALDIDEDGVVNEKDFAPYINNYYVYAGSISTLLIIVISIIVSLNAKRRNINYKKKVREYGIKIEEWESEGFSGKVLLNFKKRWLN